MTCLKKMHIYKVFDNSRDNTHRASRAD